MLEHDVIYLFFKLHVIRAFKLIIKYADEKTEVSDILFYWLKYLSIKNISFITNHHEMYEYYELEKPPNGWIDYCCTRYVIV